MRRSLIVLSAAGVLATVGVGSLAAQHRAHGGAASAPAAHAWPLLHGCPGLAAGDGQAAQPHVPDHLAQALELTPTQIAEIDRKASEGCRLIARVHDEMMAVLTPDQRAALHAMHANGRGHGGLVELLKKLHGGD